ncbi:prevent-host-death family protein [Mycolicibacterium rhodesiae JS60]|nr:prevent-host-death family protein [Mycolicibacterium rhodesiae JS60]
MARRSASHYAGAVARTIAQRELRNESAKLMDAVAAGETFVITRHGEPVAELRPIQPGRKTFTSRDDLARIAGAGVRIDPDQFRRDLDAAIDQGV